jgi:hypothetical protein
MIERKRMHHRKQVRRISRVFETDYKLCSATDEMTP